MAVAVAASISTSRSLGGWSKPRLRSCSGTRRGPVAVRCACRPSAGAGAALAPNFYEVLGLSQQDVDVDIIKSAYRKLARKLHPDVCPHEEREECTRRFIVLQEAYETLSDTRRRAMYDLAMSGGLDPHGIARWSGDDLVSSDWRSRWEDQLLGLRRRSRFKEGPATESWAARVRRKQHEQEPVCC